MTTSKQLRELAEKATPGKWELSVHTNPVGSFDAKKDDWTISVGGTRIVAMEDGFRNASDVRFIAAASPATILALLDENEALQAECEALREALEDISGTHHHSASAGEYFAKVAREALAAYRKGDQP